MAKAPVAPVLTVIVFFTGASFRSWPVVSVLLIGVVVRSWDQDVRQDYARARG